MENGKRQPADINAYIAAFPEPVRERLEALRQAIREAAPKATEAISYQMPAFKQNGNLVYFAAWKEHIGFYPVPSATAAFEKELAGFKRSKGGVQFPMDEPLPLELVRKIVRFRVQENELKQQRKKKTK